jgi:polyferredoxin
LLAIGAGTAFLALFLVAQWFFSAFLISHSAENWFFAGDRHWGYRENIGDWRSKFWSETNPQWNRPLTAKGLLAALGLSIAASRVGLWLGNWMAKVRR